jgi:hypothetical protein
MKADGSVFRRVAIRAALRIHEHLGGPARQIDFGSLPTDRWQEIERAQRRLQHCQRRGWTAACEAVLNDLNYQLRYLVNALDAKRVALPAASVRTPVSPASAIAADLLVLGGKFEEVEIDLKHKLLRVTAGPPHISTPATCHRVRFVFRRWARSSPTNSPAKRPICRAT